MPVELSIIETETELGVLESTVVIESATTPGPAGVGVPGGGTEGQVLAKASATDFDTEWVDQTGGGGSGVVETVVAGAGVSVDSTDPANPIVTAQVTQAELDAEAATRAAADTALDSRVDALEAVDPLTQTEGDARYWQLTTDLATQVELNAEAALARNADNLTSGTVADARVASTIARDSEVSAAISASEAGQVRDGDAAGGVLSGTYPNPGFAADMATQAELDSEASARAAADTALDGRVDTLEALTVPLVYVHDGTDYEGPIERVFFGEPDPTTEGFTGADGDAWITPAGDLSLYAALASPLSGDFTGTYGAPEIAGGVIADEHVSATAGIARSKLASIEAIRRVGAVGQPAFAGTWSNFAGGYETAGFWKDESSGLVYLCGLVKSTSTDVTIFTLPVGYRPAVSAANLFTTSKVVVSTLSLEQVTIASTGTVSVATAAAHVTQTLDGICFRAA